MKSATLLGTFLLGMLVLGLRTERRTLRTMSFPGTFEMTLRPTKITVDASGCRDNLATGAIAIQSC
jgi:hypothetical protein